MATREPPVELFYDPAELDREAPRLRIGKNDGVWELRDDDGALLGCHASLPDALDAALAQSSIRFREILVRGANGRQEWAAHHNPEWMELARALNRTPAAQQGLTGRLSDGADGAKFRRCM